MRNPKPELQPRRPTRDHPFAVFKLKLPLLFVATLAPLCSFAQYSIDWSTVDGGGGTSTGGVYSVSGTIGQPDAGTMNGGSFTLQGGFWGGVVAIQTPGAPWLSITRTATNTVVISWPASTDGWMLECTNQLTTAAIAWPQIPPPYPNSSGTCRVIVTNIPPANQYFRLHKP